MCLSDLLLDWMRVHGEERHGFLRKIYGGKWEARVKKKKKKSVSLSYVM